MRNFKSVFAFVAGLTIGSATTYKCLKVVFETRAQEEIDSVKAVYRNSNTVVTEEDCSDDNDSSDDVEDDQEKSTYEKMSSLYTVDDEKHDYTSYSKVVVKTDEMLDEPEEKFDTPYVIDEEEFGAYDDYTLAGLTFYADDVLTDSVDDVVENPEDLVGDDFRHRFVNDIVYVRNDRLRIDYEIIRDSRTYEQVAVLPY